MAARAAVAHGWRRPRSLAARVRHGTLVSGGATSLTLAFFLVLPLIQAIGKKPAADTLVRAADVANIPPPPAPPEPEPEKDPPPEEKPPELDESEPPLDLSQMELALQAGNGSWMQGGFAGKLDTLLGGRKDAETLFSRTDLDQEPRAIYQVSPTLDAVLRRKAPGKVFVLFVVDPQGKVESPRVQSSTDPVFEASALAAVKKWKFEPGKRKGKVVRFRMRVPITFQ